MDWTGLERIMLDWPGLPCLAWLGLGFDEQLERPPRSPGGGGASTPPWATAAAVGPGAVRHRSRGGGGGIDWEGHTQILAKASIY